MSVTVRFVCLMAAACSLLALGLAATAGAARKPTVTIVAISGKVTTYKKAFAVTSCRSVGTKDVTLNAKDADDYALSINAKRLPGTIWIRGGDDEDALDIRGKVTSVTRKGSPGQRNVTVKGTFAPGGIPGAFTVTGDCP